MEIKRDTTREIIERFCPVVDENVGLEVLSRDEKGKHTLRCLREEECGEARGGCTNSLREYWR